MGNLLFHGHESFPCRQFWLKKGFDLVSQNKSFNDEAVVDLGVGRNMVTAVRHWLRSFHIIDRNEKITPLAEKIFDENGWDPFLEDEGTIWLLHSLFVTCGYASIGNIIFNELRKEKPEFTPEHFIKFVTREKGSFNENTLKRDFGAFKSSYVVNNSKDIEDNYSGILTELNLLNESKRDSQFFYHIENTERPHIPAKIVLACILMHSDYGDSISFETMKNGHNSVGVVFALNQKGLHQKIEEICDLYADIVFTDDAGIRELQFKKGRPDFMEVLASYYGY